MLELDVELSRGPFKLAMKTRIGAGITGVSGPSGAGKSTLLGILAGLVVPARGRIVMADDILFDSAHRIHVPAHRRHIGLVFQSGQLFPHLPVRQNLLYGYQRQAAAARRFELDEVARLLEITPLLERRPASLSGGEQQRVALGRALLSSPRLLLLDEPLAALDDRLKDQILDFLRRIRDETGIPMLYVSHSTREIAALTESILHVDKGRVTNEAPSNSQDFRKP